MSQKAWFCVIRLWKIIFITKPRFSSMWCVFVKIHGIPLEEPWFINRVALETTFLKSHQFCGGMALKNVSEKNICDFLVRRSYKFSEKYSGGSNITPFSVRRSINIFAKISSSCKKILQNSAIFQVDAFLKFHDLAKSILENIPGNHVLQ